MTDKPSCKFYRPIKEEIKEEIIELKPPSVETGTVEEHIEYMKSFESKYPYRYLDAVKLFTTYDEVPNIAEAAKCILAEIDEANKIKYKEHILCAAIWVNDGAFHEHQPKNISTGYVISGRRHHNCFATIVDLIGLDEAIKLRKYHNLKSQGFITNLDRFVDRKEAWEIALAAKQIRYGLEAVDKENPILISENLY